MRFSPAVPHSGCTRQSRQCPRPSACASALRPALRCSARRERRHRWGLSRLRSHDPSRFAPADAGASRNDALRPEYVFARWSHCRVRAARAACTPWFWRTAGRLRAGGHRPTRLSLRWIGRARPEPVCRTRPRAGGTVRIRGKRSYRCLHCHRHHRRCRRGRSLGSRGNSASLFGRTPGR